MVIVAGLVVGGEGGHVLVRRRHLRDRDACALRNGAVHGPRESPADQRCARVCVAYARASSRGLKRAGGTSCSASPSRTRVVCARARVVRDPDDLPWGAAPLAYAFDMVGLKWVSIVVAFGSIFGLTTSTFTSLLGQPRIFFRMASDVRARARAEAAVCISE